MGGADGLWATTSALRAGLQIRSGGFQPPLYDLEITEKRGGWKPPLPTSATIPAFEDWL